MIDKNNSIMDFGDMKMPKHGDVTKSLHPSFYLHFALLTSQKVLLMSVAEGKMADGLLGYTLVIEHMETISRAAGFLDKNPEEKNPEEEKGYDDLLEEFKASPEFIDVKRDDVRNTRLSNYKLQLILQYVFEEKILTTPLKDTSMRVRKALAFLKEHEEKERKYKETAEKLKEKVSEDNKT